MVGLIAKELRHHAPFTLFGAATGIAAMILFQGISFRIAYNVFYVFHPLHVLLSALVTSSMYRKYRCGEDGGRCRLLGLLFIGYVGSVGIATLSDSIIPYLSEALLGLPNRHAHIGFIEEWWLVNPMALIGIAIAYFKGATKIPHSGHVLLSTWASLFHVLMAMGFALSWYSYIVILVFLFLAVWIPCCVSDIVFPLLFAGSAPKGLCGHGHP